jgi:hypothetical protein
MLAQEWQSALRRAHKYLRHVNKSCQITAGYLIANIINDSMLGTTQFSAKKPI